MTRKHYVRIAAILAGDLAICANDGERQRVRGITLSLADVMAQDNGAFDRARFYVAAGLTPDGSLKA